MRVQKNIYLPALFLLSISIFTACVSSEYFQYVEQEYRNKQQSSATIIIAPLITDLVAPGQREEIFNSKNTKRRMLSSKEKSLFENYMPPIFSDYTQATVLETEASFKFPEFKFSLEKYTTDDNRSIALYTPANSDKLKYKDDVPDYILFTQDLYFNKNVEDQGPSIGRGSSSSFSILGGMDYLLWDNKRGKAAAYGSIQKGFQLFELPSKEEYLMMLDFFASSIIQNSPLAYKQIRY